MKSILKITLLIFLLYSCEYNYEENPINTDCTDTEISFIETIKPIIDNNCLNCHNGDEPPNLSTYEEIKADTEEIQEDVFHRIMPSDRRLSNQDIEAIYCWIENGAPNN